MKKVLIYLMVFAFLCMASGYGIDYLVYNRIDHQSPYYLSFASIGAISLESRLDCWAKINYKLSQEELDKQSKEILSTLGIDHPKIIQNNQASDCLINYTSQTGRLTYSISAETDSDKNETYFLLHVISLDQNYDLEKIEEKLRDSNLNWQYYYLYTGKIDHYVDGESRSKLISVILENMRAEASEVYEDQYMTSSTAYTPLFDNSVTVQSQKYNLQVAAKSTSQQQQAIIYIGQPLIIGDY